MFECLILAQGVAVQVLQKGQYMVISDPVALVDGKYVNQLGERKLVEGPSAFFLFPGESTFGSYVHDSADGGPSHIVNRRCQK